MWKLAMMNMKPAQLSTAMKHRKDFPRVQQMARVKRTFKPLLLLEVIFGEHLTHQITLFNTNAMLTGQNTA